LSFTEPSFLLLLGVTLALYFVAPQRFRWCVLLVASYAFYWFVGGVFALCAITTTIVSVYLCGRWAFALREKKASRAARRAPLAVCLTFNFALLMMFRYSNVILPSFGLLLISGVSFYTFQAAGYLIDIYKGKVVAERNVFKLALFVSFFPQLVQGPISRHGEVAADLLVGHGWNAERAREGVQRIVWGYFMKLVIADVIAVPVNAVFGDYRAYGGAVILIAVLMYSVQIYADFAGGINVAIGIGKLVGVTMSENFAQPFFARSLSDFWRRWHITLGTWLKDYLFYPLAISKAFGKFGKAARRLLGAEKGKLVPACAATFIIYLVVGVWHGITWVAVAFGLLNGAIITLSLFCEPTIATLRRKTHLDGSKSGFGRVFATLRTFAIVTFLRYFARAASLHAALAMLKRTLLTPRLHQLSDGTLLGLGIGRQEYVLLAVAIVILLARDIIAERGAAHGNTAADTLNKAWPIVQFAAMVLILGLITYCGIYRDGYIISDFIYANH